MRIENLMEANFPMQIDIEKVVKKKAPELGKKLPAFLFRFLEKTICQEQMNAILRKYAGCEGVDFAKALLSELNVTTRVEGLENIPEKGRFTFASNHPLGGLDGVSFVSIFGEKYPSSIKFVVNDLLMNVQERWNATGSNDSYVCSRSRGCGNLQGRNIRFFAR